jgi:phage repressor protein C with HTH and peptisase S24 domain
MFSLVFIEPTRKWVDNIKIYVRYNGVVWTKLI